MTRAARGARCRSPPPLRPPQKDTARCPGEQEGRGSSGRLGALEPPFPVVEQARGGRLPQPPLPHCASSPSRAGSMTGWSPGRPARSVAASSLAPGQSANAHDQLAVVFGPEHASRPGASSGPMTACSSPSRPREFEPMFTPGRPLAGGSPTFIAQPAMSSGARSAACSGHAPACREQLASRRSAAIASLSATAARWCRATGHGAGRQWTKAVRTLVAGARTVDVGRLGVGECSQGAPALPSTTEMSVVRQAGRRANEGLNPYRSYPART